MTDPVLRRALALALVPAGVAIAGFFALAWIPSVFYDGAVLPSGHDAMYHARRILDAIDAPWAVVQFDSTIHAPEGSWVPWPWGFDALLALIARVLRDLAGIAPIKTLVFVPPAFLVVNVALVAASARALRLPLAAQWIAVLCFAFSPLTQELHGIGQVDHHFLESTFVLAALWCGLRWLDAPAQVRPAVALGLVLGTANGVQNGLFLLQLPVVITLTLLWFRGRRPEPRAAAALAAALMATTLAIALPSQALQAGFLRYDLLSWFQVYVACLSALAVLLMARLAPDAGGIVRCLLIAAVVLLPLAREALAGLGFVTADIYQKMLMPEMRKPFGAWGTAALAETWRQYSGLIFLLPLGMVGAAVAALRAREARLVYLCVFALLGGLMLSQQYRFQHFGSFALYLLPLAFLVQRFRPERAQHLALLAFAALCGVAYAPALPEMLSQAPAPGGSSDFVLTRSLYPPLAAACAERPGVVLADHNDGHYVRFFTECAVIANNLVLGPESWQKLREARALLDSAPAVVRERAPWIRYVLVRRDDDVFDAAAPAEVLRQNSTLRRALLLEAPPWPPGYVLLAEVRVETGVGAATVLARLFELPDNGAPASPPPRRP